MAIYCRLCLDSIFTEFINNYSTFYYDYYDTSNKFGFDKIIFVCDVENIRNIFAAKYGQKLTLGDILINFILLKFFILIIKSQFLNLLEI